MMRGVVLQAASSLQCAGGLLHVQPCKSGVDYKQVSLILELSVIVMSTQCLSLSAFGEATACFDTIIVFAS